MTRLLDSPKVDRAAVAAAVDGLRDRGATCQTYIRADGIDVCVNAVNAGDDGWPGYSEAASRRAATGGRRMLPVLDSGEIEGRLWIAYDMGSATPLPDHRGRHPLPTATSLRVLADVARALDGAAAEGVFASELPPGSVFVSGKGARPGDLGTAREGLAGAEYELESDPVYVPPEVLRGKSAGERSGAYLYGALLYYLLTGASPHRGRPTRSASAQPDLPASITAMVATAMADDPESRPASVSAAHEMARRALRGEPPVRARKPRVARSVTEKPAAPKAAIFEGAEPKGAASRAATALKKATAKRATPKGATAEQAARDPAAAKRATPNATTAEQAARDPAAATRATPNATTAEQAARDPAAARRATPKAAAAMPGAPRRAAAKPATARRGPATPATRRHAVAVFGALLLGAAAGSLLANSPEPEPARAQTVTAGDLSVTVLSGRHRVEHGDRGLSVRAQGSLLRAHIARQPLEPGPHARPVQLGVLQAWRRTNGSVVRYSVPTREGTLEVTCRITASGSPRSLRLCERTASTLRLREARALPLATAAENSQRLHTAIATLGTERDAARARLGGASTPAEQRGIAQDLAGSHQRAAAILHGLAGAESIEAAARGAADAYSRLASSARRGSAERWSEASKRVRRSDATLAEAIAAAG